MSKSAVAQARQHFGAEPLRALFEASAKARSEQDPKQYQLSASAWRDPDRSANLLDPGCEIWSYAIKEMLGAKELLASILDDSLASML